MKNLFTLTCALLLAVVANATNKQDTLYVMDEGALVAKHAVADIDSMTFTLPEGMAIEEPQPKAKYIFYFIGDGMAAPQINMGELAAKMDGYAQDLTEDVIGELNMTQFPVVGMQRTHATNRYITGSAASATALATGYKTSINTISQTPDHTANYKTIAELAKANGMLVGVVSSVSIDHATPACFYAHALTRNYYNYIAKQMASSGFDYFGGGWAKGLRSKYAAENRNPAGHVSVTDSMYMINAGYTVVNTRNDFDNLSSTPAWAYTSMGDGSGSLPYVMDLEQADNGADITLSEFTQKGIELMQDNKKGFFMMIEGGKIDWACHANDVVAATENTLEFDRAIGKAMAFMAQHPDSTLIVVTGDHETGGLTIGYAATKYETALEVLNEQTESYEVFDDRMSGWSSANISDAMAAMTAVFGLGDSTTAANDALVLSANEQVELAEAFYKSCANAQPFEGKASEEFLKSGGYNPFTMAICHIYNKKAGIAWTSYSHTAVPVPVLAKGAGAEKFAGYYENTAIPVMIKDAAQFEGAFPAILAD